MNDTPKCSHEVAAVNNCQNQTGMLLDGWQAQLLSARV